MSQAAYMNGYDDGYEDAKRELTKSGGSVSDSSGSGSSQPIARSAGVFTIDKTNVNWINADDGESYVEGLTGMFNATQLPTSITGDSSCEVTVTPPSGGFIEGDIVLFGFTCISYASIQLNNVQVTSFGAGPIYSANYPDEDNVTTSGKFFLAMVYANNSFTRLHVFEEHNF